jgi:hypothetical protein
MRVTISFLKRSMPNLIALKYDSHLDLCRVISAVVVANGEPEQKKDNIYIEGSIVDYLKKNPWVKGLIKEENDTLTIECQLTISSDKERWTIELNSPEIDKSPARPIGVTEGIIDHSRGGMIILIP